MDICAKLQVKAVIVKDNQVIAEGTNSPIDPCDGNCEVNKACIKTIHAENQALMLCARKGVSTDGAECWVTHLPCPDCTKNLNQAGIKRIYYMNEYPHRYENNFSDGMELMKI
ncbi:deoxycytidylate deaminase [Salicibibacter kimchii]|uniref:Deaminase n=1 Tax=Salicibibacter kimchii TaxID=2099786 RepID=A0A345BUH2_9BACI|nr:deaminase [Salicibibacter kimchii]